MVKYLCHNCDDLLLKKLSSVVNHVWDKHKIEVTKEWRPSIRAENAFLPPKKLGTRKVSGFRCEDCQVSLKNVKSFLAHLDELHGIHIWYEKGIVHKRIFLDGILDSDTNRSETEQRAVQVSEKNIPLSERPYEPRKR